MPYVSPELLSKAAEGLSGRHPLAIVTIPALLQASREQGATQPAMVEFGSTPERVLLDQAFRLRGGPKPYAAVWSHPVLFVNSDFAGSSLQKQRTRDGNFVGPVFEFEARGDTNRRTHFSLTADAGSQMLSASYDREVRKIDLAVWLGRDVEIHAVSDLLSWFDAQFPFGATDLDVLYPADVPDAYRSLPLGESPATREEIAAALNLGLKYPVEHIAPGADVDSVDDADAPNDAETLNWTSDLCGTPLSVADVSDLAERISAEIRSRGLSFNDPEKMARRCATALLTGHLILTGPPGTGKTTLARLIADVFNVRLRTSTATSEWTPYHVVGGLRPDAEKQFAARHGYVTQAVLDCARVTHTHLQAAEDARPNLKQGTWLFIDELNRADIDQAIGSLYTALASVTADDRRSAPIDLWFESTPARQQLWLPGTFRIIAAMNDVDTNFVNPMSQGLTRRFTRIAVLPPAREQVPAEVEGTLRQAHRWLADTYGDVLPSDGVTALDALRTKHDSSLETFRSVLVALRYPDEGAGWPLGSAQVLDVLRGAVLRWQSAEDDDIGVLDEVMADRLVPQMGALDDGQLDRYRLSLDHLGLRETVAALSHLQDPNRLT